MSLTRLSATVKALRKSSGLTQEDLAMKSGVGLNFVRNLEQGKRTLRMDKVNDVPEKMKVDYCALLDKRNRALDVTK